MNPAAYAMLLLRVLDLVLPTLVRTSSKAAELRAMVDSGTEPTLEQWDALFAELHAEGVRLDEAIARLHASR